MVEFNLGKVNTLDNIKKNLSGIAEGIVDYSYYSGVGSPSRTEEDLKISEKDIKGFVKRRKAAIEKQKKDGALGLTKTIIEESYNPRFSLDYNEKLPILPGLYTQSNTAIKDKLIAEQLNIAQQKEDYKASLSNKPPPNLGLMSPRELLKSLNTSDFTPIAPPGLTDGPVAPPPDKPTDINNLPFFSLTGPSETGPTGGGILRFLGPAQFTNPLVKPPGSLGSGFGFNLKGMKGLDPESYLTKSIVANIQKNSDETGKALLKDALELKGVNIKDRFRTIKANVDNPVTVDDMMGVDEVRLLPEFDTNLPENSKVIKEALAKGNPKNLPVLRVKDLMMKEDLSGLGVSETKKSPFFIDNVAAYFSKYPEKNGFESVGYKRGIPAFKVAFSEQGVGLKAKGVTSPYGLSKTYKHPGVVGGEGDAPLYGHVRSLELKELAEDTVHPFTGEEIASKFGDSQRFPLAKLPGAYSQMRDLEDYGMLDSSKKVRLEKITRGGEDASIYDESTAGFNNYGIKSGTEEDDFIGDFIVQYPKNLSTLNASTVESLLTFKQRMQKINALLQLVPVPNISLQARIKDSGNFGTLLRGGIENNRMTIDDVLQFIKGEEVFQDYAKGTPSVSNLLDSSSSNTKILRAIEDSISKYAKVAIHNSFSSVNMKPITGEMFLPGLSKEVNSQLPNIYINTGVGEFSQTVKEFKGRAGEPVTIENLIDYIHTLAKIDAQSLILGTQKLTSKYKLQDVPGFASRPKIRLNNETGMFEPVPVTPAADRLDEIQDAINTNQILDIDGEASAIINDTGIINNIRDLISWNDLKGPELYKLYRASAAGNPKSLTSVNFPSELRDRLKSIELNWGKGKRIKRLGEEQFDTFKKSQFKSPEIMLENMRMQQRGDAILTPEQQMERFEFAHNLDEEIDTTRAFAYSDTATSKAFANLQKRPDKLIEISTLHNVKQAIQDGFDKLQFNTFTTMAELARWNVGVFDDAVTRKRYLESPFEGKISTSDKALYKLVTEDFEELGTLTNMFNKLPDLAKKSNIQERNAFQKFWNSYNEKFNLDELVGKFIKEDMTDRNGEFAKYFVDNFTRKHEVALSGVAMTSYNKYSNTQEILDLFSKEKSKNIYKHFQKTDSLFSNSRYNDEEYLQALVDASNRVRIIQYFKPPVGSSPLAYYAERKYNPFYLKYGMPSDRELDELVSKMPYTNSDGEVKQKNLGFSVQYGKYKIKALESLGLEPKVIRPDEDNPFTFLEVNLGETAAEKEALLERLNKTEIDLYSQYMPIPNFEERSEEEMGAT